MSSPTLKRRHGASSLAQTLKKRRRRSPSLVTPKNTFAPSEPDNHVQGSDRGVQGLRVLPSSSSSERSASHEVNESDEEPFYDHYSVSADEVREDDDLILVGEDPSVEDGTIPLRGLNQFTIYFDKTKELVDIASLIFERDSPNLHPYRVSGYVTPWTELDSDVDDEVGTDPDLGQYVQLSHIRELNLFHYTRMDVDSKMYIETEYGWYVLEDPSEAYKPFFQNFWFKHKTTYFLLSESLRNAAVNKDQFLESMSLHDEYPPSVLQRIVGGINDEDVRAFALGFILELPVNINHILLIRQIFGELPDGEIVEDGDADPVSVVKNVQNSETAVTPAVLQVCRRLFPQRHRFKLCDNMINRPTPPHCDPHAEVHSANPTITWQTKSCAKYHYTSVLIDSTVYSVGDVVIIEKGEDSNMNRDENSGQEFSMSINTLANSKWFARILYMYEESSQKFFHGQWLQHGSQTVLQEAAHPSILFSMLECDDILLESIVTRCNIINPEHNDNTLLLDYDPQHENRFICGLTWDEDRSAFVDFSKDQIDYALQHCPIDEQCLSCGMRAQRQEFKTPRVIKPDLLFLGIRFRKHDFAYVANDSDDHLHTIGQILYIGDNLMVALRVYERREDIKKPFDELHLKSFKQILTVPAHRLEGMCWAKLESELTSEDQKRAWLSKEDHFVIDNSNAEFVIERIGLRLHEKGLEREETLRKKNKLLKGLELFAGAGGFGTGLEMSGFFKTMWAVEFDSSAAITFRENHSETLVFNHDCNLFLAHAVQGKPLQCVDGDESTLQCLPRPGDVDIIFGGPPCQAFSGMNHYKDPDDPRVALVCNMISHVEYYRPKYFMLENVERMLDYPVGSTLDGRSFVGGIKKGVLKFILASLTSLGYQVHFKVLQAGRYAVPQNRERVIFLASKRGIPLPQFPLPSHVFNRRATTKNLANGERLAPVSWAGENSAEHVCSCAPMPAVTMDDFFGDLPRFDWKDPHVLLPKGKNRREVWRLNQGIRVFDAVTATDETTSGFLRPEPYLCPPKTMYQARTRENIRDGKITLHYTRRYQASIVERVVNVPMEPEADHSDLPKELQVCIKHVGTKVDGGHQQYRRTYRRVDGQRHMDTLTTNPNPFSKGAAIHPYEKRALSVREYARLQGFPDTYKFVAAKKSVVGQQYKQIGNAVPVPLAMALGRAIGKAALQVQQQEDGRTMTQKEESPEL